MAYERADHPRREPTTLCEFLRWLHERARPAMDHSHIRGEDRTYHSRLVLALAEEFTEEKYGAKLEGGIKNAH